MPFIQVLVEERRHEKDSLARCEREEGWGRVRFRTRLLVESFGAWPGERERTAEDSDGPRSVCCVVLQLLGWQRVPPAFIRLSVQGSKEQGGPVFGPLFVGGGVPCKCAGLLGNVAAGGTVQAFSHWAPEPWFGHCPPYCEPMWNPMRVRLEAGTGGDVYTLWLGCFDCVGCDVNGKGVCSFSGRRSGHLSRRGFCLNVQRRLVNCN